ncbi:TRAP transporter substrate-binding protein [Cribrihabitans pelagius]|uniref:TRAP transporter substrate-binding protein n=1 Tax=Cribrihabitans pelagius TaxID=1765746 RepID=UPI003B5CA460
MKKTMQWVTAAVLTAAAGGAMAETYDLKVLGQPVATGLIQKNVEQPFFENFAERSGLDAAADYKPLDVTGIKDTEQLRILKAGLFDIVSLRMSQISRDEPTILGLDLVGLNPDYETGRKTVAAFEDAVDAQLQTKFNTKLLGVWPFGPQVLFCKPEIGELSDLKGKKVRVYDQNLANFVASVGGTPVPIGFPDVHQSLARGVVDCAITGPSSANSAGWPEVTGYMLPVAFQLALNGYGINLDSYNAMATEDQQKLEAAFDGLVDEIWAYSEELFDDAVRCNVGESPCETVKSYDLKLVPVSDGDRQIIGNAVTAISFPAWAEVCDATNASCSADWKAALGQSN